MIHADDAYNVIPQTAALAGTVRAFSREMMLLVEASMKRVAASTAEAFGVKAEVDFRALFAPTVNNPLRPNSPRKSARNWSGRRTSTSGADHGLGGFLLQAVSVCRAATSSSATARSKAAAKCTTPRTISTTPRCRLGLRSSDGW